MADTMPAAPLVVLDLAAEGAGLKLLRREGPDGAEFYTEGISIGMDENDDEVWHTIREGPVATWEQALALLPPFWPVFGPIRIAPGYGAQVRAAWEAQAAERSAKGEPLPAGRALEWQEACRRAA